MQDTNVVSVSPTGLSPQDSVSPTCWCSSSLLTKFTVRNDPLIPEDAYITGERWAVPLVPEFRENPVLAPPPHILLLVAGDRAGEVASPHLILLSAALEMNIIASVFCAALAMDLGVGMKQRNRTLVSSSLLCLVNICNIPTVSKAVF